MLSRWSHRISRSRARRVAVKTLAVLLPLCRQSTSLVGQENGAIEVVVLEDGSDRPLAGAEISLRSMQRISNEFAAAVPAGSTQTDSAGRFSFRNLPPGGYIIEVKAEGHITDRQSPDGPVGRLELVTLAPGETTKSITIRLPRVGTIRGRITDTARMPIAGIAVEALLEVYDQSGGKTFSGAYSANTNERGEYRISAPPQHAYYVKAGGVSFTGKPVDAYAAALYPGVTDLAKATTVEVRADDAVVLPDIVLGPRRLYAVRGRVVDRKTGQPPPEANAWITPTSILGGETITESPRYNAAAGTFETRVGPGRYAVGVTVPMSRIPPLTIGRIELPPVAAEQLVEITDHDVDGMVFTLAPRMNIRGRISVDGKPSALPAAFRDVRIALLPSRDGRALYMPPNAPVQLAPFLAPDGTFELIDVQPGEFHLDVKGFPDDAYLKTARWGSMDLLTGPLRITSETNNTLEVVLNSTGGRIEGTASTSGRPAPASKVVLVPTRRERLDLFKSAKADSTGRFVLQGIPPGDYDLFAWARLEGYEYFDPHFLQRFQNQSKRVTVAESSKLQLDLPAQ